MELKNKQKNVKLIIEDELLNNIETLGFNCYPNECGGFLVGYYSNDLMSLYVTDYILPNKQKGSPSFFERSSEGLKQIFHQLFSLKRQYYIGEWHTHPNGSSMYSYTDLNAMRQIASSTNVSIENPILLILGIINNSPSEISAYIYDNKELFKYE